VTSKNIKEAVKNHLSIILNARKNKKKEKKKRRRKEKEKKKKE